MGQPGWLVLCYRMTPLVLKPWGLCKWIILAWSHTRLTGRNPEPGPPSRSLEDLCTGQHFKPGAFSVGKQAERLRICPARSFPCLFAGLVNDVTQERTEIVPEVLLLTCL